jgi:hypothetical protein
MTARIAADRSTAPSYRHFACSGPDMAQPQTSSGEDMAKQKPAKETEKKIDPSTSKPCPDDFQSKSDLDGKNDSGPDPEIHGREIPPQ